MARRMVEKVWENPHRYVPRLLNSPFYRLRVGTYRVIPDLHGGMLRILVLTVGARDTID